MSTAGNLVCARTGHALNPRHNEFAQALLAGLKAQRRHISSKYFYDREGSDLFERICELPEYYPTRTEIGLLRRHAGEIAEFMGPDATLIEFGAGALQKVGLLLDRLEAPRAYVPIDISGDYLHTMVEELASTYPNLTVQPVVADFTKPFALPAVTAGSRRIGFFPGSTIGNLERADAISFLRKAAGMLKGGGLLIGVDLVKDPAVLHAAYNDAQGVTASFNKNVLARANRDLMADFDLDRFAHYAFYNPLQQRIEMHLLSLADQTVEICGEDIAFAEGDSIHTENSHKYTVPGFKALAAEAGFVVCATWTDPKRLFSLHWMEPRD